MGSSSILSAARRVGLPAFAALVTVLFFFGSAASPAYAGGHRARLSSVLTEQLGAPQAQLSRVIVHGSAEEVEALAARHGVRVVRLMASGAVLELSGDGLDSVSQDPEVDHLSADMRVQRTMSVTATTTGADQVWAGLESLAGVSGRGVGIAVIDSGIDHHPALRHRIVASVDFITGRGPGRDAYGHGTHVAGIIAGASKEFSGMAPGAHLVNLRVLDEEGAGYTSDVVDAIDWAIVNRDKYGIRIINLSLGHGVVETYRDDPMCEAVERAVAAKILVVASAGNYGKLPDGRAVIGGITSPGNSPWALTVGALNTKGTADRSDDVMATYSSRGPTYLDGIVKPDLVAPGNRIVSLGAPSSSLWESHPEQQRPGNAAYMELSGSSMSAAVVSGAAALLLEA
ncbi:MAG: S8 family peptidase, partial [Vicinamibacterales bacterium]